LRVLGGEGKRTGSLWHLQVPGRRFAAGPKGRGGSAAEHSLHPLQDHSKPASRRLCHFCGCRDENPRRVRSGATRRQDAAWRRARRAEAAGRRAFPSPSFVGELTASYLPEPPLLLAPDSAATPKWSSARRWICQRFVHTRFRQNPHHCQTNTQAGTHSTVSLTTASPPPSACATRLLAAAR